MQKYMYIACHKFKEKIRIQIYLSTYFQQVSKGKILEVEIFCISFYRKEHG